MCTCLKDREKQFTEMIIKQVGKKNIGKTELAGFTNKLLPLTTDAGWTFMLPFEFIYFPKKADGSITKNKKIVKTNLMVNYCPICGEKRVAEEELTTDKLTANQKNWLRFMLKGFGFGDTAKDFNKKEREEMQVLIDAGYVTHGKNHSGPDGKMFHIKEEDRAKAEKLLGSEN